MKQKSFKSGLLARRAAIESIDKENRQINLTFSSEAMVRAWYGWEILDHSPGSVRMDRLNTKGPFLSEHDRTKQIGVIEQASIGADRKGRAVVRFGKSALAEEEFNAVLDEVRTNTSFYYRVHKIEPEGMKDGEPVYRAVDWEPMEVSLVSVPEDYSVGIGRAGNEENEVVILEKETPKTESERSIEKMPPKIEVKESEKAPAKVDVEAIRAEVRSAELSRAREILAIGEQHKQTEMARAYINDGKSLEDFRRAVLDEHAKSAKPIKTQDETPEIGLSKKEIKQYSFIRAIRTQIDPTEKGEFEREASRAAAKKMNKTAQGLFVPYDVLRAEYEGQRDLTKGTGSAGGFLVSTDLLASSFIGLLRNRMMVRALGAQILGGLVGDILIPRLGGGATSYWVDENGEPSESEPNFEQVSMKPKTVGAFTEMSRKLLLQSSLDIENLVRGDLATVLALAIDLAAINGSGVSNQPKGIMNETGIGSVAIGTDGGPPLWAHMVDLESQIANKNADVNTLAYLTNSKVRGKLKQTEKATGTAQFIWENGNEPGFGMVNGYRSGVSNQVPSDLTKGSGTNLSAILFGNWSDLLIGEWGALDILVNPYANDKTGAVRVRVLQDVDIAVRHPESFAALVDATT